VSPSRAAEAQSPEFFLQARWTPPLPSEYPPSPSPLPAAGVSAPAEPTASSMCKNISQRRHLQASTPFSHDMPKARLKNSKILNDSSLKVNFNEFYLD
jgi:hypothetical protein